MVNKNKKVNIISLKSLKGVNSLEKWNDNNSIFFQESGYYLGCQLTFDSECHMFINYDLKNDTGRGNIEIFEDGAIQWFYTIHTNTEKEQYVLDLKKTPEWFQKIYFHTISSNKIEKENIRTA